MPTQTPGPDLFAQVNTPKDMARMSELERKHMPVVSAPPTVKVGEHFPVYVEVGKLIPHPNDPGHHIEFIDLYDDRVFLCRVDLSAVRTSPKVTFCITLPKGGTLRALARCNLHGVWEGTRPVAVLGSA